MNKLSNIVRNFTGKTLLFLLASTCLEPACAATLFWSEGGFGAGTIMRMDLANPGAPLAIVSSGGSISAISLDTTANRLYWTGDGALRSSNLDGNAMTTVASGFGFSEGIAVDPSTGTVLWTTWSGDLNRANVDGTNATTLYSDSQQLFGLAYDQETGLIYWSADDTNLYSSDSNGTNVISLLDGGVEPLGLALDTISDKIYWADWEGQRVMRANLDGTDVEVIYASTAGNPIAVELDASSGELYWTEWNSNVIMKANLDGSGAQIVATTGANPWGLKLLSPVPVPPTLILMLSAVAALVPLRWRLF